MRDLQLELELAKEPQCRSYRRPYRKYPRGHQWFERMRQVVDNAIEWETLSKDRTGQTR